MGEKWWIGKQLPGAGFCASWAFPVMLFADVELWDWQHLLWNVVQVLIYVFIGLAFFAVAYLILDKATPFSFGQEIRENKNTAMAIVLGSVFIGIALILAAAIRG